MLLSIVSGLSSGGEVKVRESLRARGRAIKIGLENFMCRTQPGYRAYLRLKHGVGIPKSRPVAPWQNTTLKSRAEVEHAWAQVRELGVVGHGDVPKNWDALSALAVVLEHTDPSSAVLDAGAEYYSPLLPSLSLYGYRNLTGINLTFRKVVRRGPILYEPGDLTRTRFGPCSFDAITCLSVIEHGVDLDGYFKEMARILKPRGILVTSTDYWPKPLATGSAFVYDSPVKIFTEAEIRWALALSERYGFELTGPVDLIAQEKAVRWERVSLDFTYITFCLRRRS